MSSVEDSFDIPFEEIDALLQANPDDLNVIKVGIYFASKRNRPDLLSTYSSRFNAQLEKARNLLNNGQFNETIQLCHTILAAFPDHPHTLYILGLATWYNGDLQGAEGYLQQAATLIGMADPTVVSFYLNAMLHLGKVFEGQEIARSILGQDRLVLNYLEMDIAYACNLHCTACHHYSNYTSKGNVDFQLGSQWLRDWAQRIYPCMFRIVGGEPALNPQLCDYIQLVAELWPKSKRSLVSNGFFLHRHPDIYTTLAKTGTALHISLHDYPNGEEKEADMVTIQQKCSELGIFLAFYRGKKEDFSRTYQGEGMNMRPYRDGDADASWKACVARCPTIHRGLLWKCPPLAFLDLIEDRFKLRQNPEWVPYLDHKGLSLDASDEEILSYLYYSIPECDMCPSTPQPV